MALIISDEYLYHKAYKGEINVFEKNNTEKLKAFKSYVSRNIYRKIENISDIGRHMGILIDEVVEIKGKDITGWVKNTFRNFKGGGNETDAYVAKRIREAEHSVRDFTWKDNYTAQSPLRNEPLRKKLQKDFKSAITEINPNVEYREIFTFPKNRGKERFEKIKELVDLENYYCVFFKSENLVFPKLNIAIIDEKEVIFDAREYDGFYCSITDKRIVKIMLAYADEAWNLSTKIKDLYDVNEENMKIAEIESKR